MTSLLPRFTSRSASVCEPSASTTWWTSSGWSCLSSCSSSASRLGRRRNPSPRIAPMMSCRAGRVVRPRRRIEVLVHRSFPNRKKPRWTASRSTRHRGSRQRRLRRCRSRPPRRVPPPDRAGVSLTRNSALSLAWRERLPPTSSSVYESRNLARTSVRVISTGTRRSGALRFFSLDGSSYHSSMPRARYSTLTPCSSTNVRAA